MHYYVQHSSMDNVREDGTRQRIDAARLMAHRFLYNAAGAQGMRDTQAAWTALRSLLTFKASDGYRQVRVGDHYISICATK